MFYISYPSCKFLQIHIKSDLCEIIVLISTYEFTTLCFSKLSVYFISIHIICSYTLLQCVMDLSIATKAVCFFLRWGWIIFKRQPKNDLQCQGQGGNHFLRHWRELQSKDLSSGGGSGVQAVFSACGGYSGAQCILWGSTSHLAWQNLTTIACTSMFLNSSYEWLLM